MSSGLGAAFGSLSKCVSIAVVGSFPEGGAVYSSDSLSEIDSITLIGSFSLFGTVPVNDSLTLPACKSFVNTFFATQLQLVHSATVVLSVSIIHS